MTTLGRHPNVLIGVLLLAVIVLVIAAVIGLGAPAAEVPNAEIGVATPVPAEAATPTPPPVAAVPEGPVPPEIAPPPLVDCGRYPADVCAQVIALARAGNEADLVGTTHIVMDDTCPPTAQCDRQFPFDAIAVFVTAGGDTTGWNAFHVFGLGNQPTQAERWQEEIPRHIVDRIGAALAQP